MACEYCGDLKRCTGFNFCPMCGEDLTINAKLIAFGKWIDEHAQIELNKALIRHLKDTDTVECDGESLTVEYRVSDAKPADMGFNLDTIDIHRELELLRKHLDHPTTEA